MSKSIDLGDVDISLEPALTGWPDMDNGSLRFKFFGGKSVNEILRDMPMVRSSAPGLPTSFGQSSIIEHAVVLGSSVTGLGSSNRPKRWIDDSNFYAIVRSCLNIRRSVPLFIHSKFNTAQQVTYEPGIVGGSNFYGPRKQVKILVVGKHPTAGEYEGNGIPFSDDRHNLLWKAWHTAGLPHRSCGDVYLTNLVRYYPPAWAAKKLPKASLDDGKYLLFQELILTKPEWIVLLGAEPLKAVFGKNAKVKSFTGSVSNFSLDCRLSISEPEDIRNIRVIVTEDPAKCIIDPAYYSTLLSTFRIMSEVGGFASPTKMFSEATLTNNKVGLDHKPVYFENELIEAVDEACDLSKNGGYVSVDCEWEGSHPRDDGAYLYTVQFSCKPGHARSVFFTRCGGSEGNIRREVLEQQLHRLLVRARNRGARIIGHNLKADLLWLEAYGCNLYPQFLPLKNDPDADGTNSLFAAQKTYTHGFFDTYIAAHCIEETAEKKLEVLGANHLGIARYDQGVQKWIEEYCKEQGIKRDDLPGYGNCPEEIILPYGCMDVDVTGQLYLKFNGDPTKNTRGDLDKDRQGNYARVGYNVLIGAAGAWAEMERFGLGVDVEEHRRVRSKLINIRLETEERIRKTINWPNFNFNSTRQKQLLLFGSEYLEPKYDKNGHLIDEVPADAIRLNLSPYKATSSGNENLWEKAQLWCERKGLPPPSPSTDSETLIWLSHNNNIVKDLYRLQAVNTQLKSFLRPSEGEVEFIKCEREGKTLSPSILAKLEEGKFTKGLMKYINKDERVRSMFGLAETMRCTSSRPNLQNSSDRANEILDSILGVETGSPDAIVIRNVFVSAPGHYFVTFDLVGAEIAVAAWMSGDKLLLEHAKRNTLKSDDPDYIDLHSDLAVRAFKLNCAPNKDELKKRGFIRYRKAAKPARFGLYYGGSTETLWRKALEEDNTLTLKDMESLIEAHNEMYPDLIGFFNAAKSRVRSPGWIRLPFGNLRRFFPDVPNDMIAKQEREAQNVVCQNPVADSVSVILANLIDYRLEHDLNFKIVLSVHDSVTLEVPKNELNIVVDEVVPTCAQKLLPFIPTNLDGRPVKREDTPYKFAIEVDVGKRLGEKLPESEWRKAV